MKYLQIYDHNGNLSKEFPVYLDGADFKWEALHPEAIWLGTIWIVSEPSELLIASEPEPEPMSLCLEMSTSNLQPVVIPNIYTSRYLSLVTGRNMKYEPKKSDTTSSRTARNRQKNGAKRSKAVSKRKS